MAWNAQPLNSPAGLQPPQEVPGYGQKTDAQTMEQYPQQDAMDIEANSVEEEGELETDSYSLSSKMPVEVRHGFIRKVYGILLFQLALTMAVGWVMYTTIGDVAETTVIVLICGSGLTTIGFICCFSCYPELMRKTPVNYIILTLFTIGEAVLVGIISSAYTAESVLIALGVTATVVLGLTLFACQTKHDFTGCGPFLFVMLLCLTCFGLTLMVVALMGGSSSPAFKVVNLLYACLGAMLFSFFIVLDTQLIVGGDHTSMQFGIDDYVPAAISLYTDIIQLFIMVLRCLGNRN